MTNLEYAASLRLVADFYESHPDMPVPRYPDVNIYEWERETFLKAAIELSRGGKVQKIADEKEAFNPKYHVRRAFGGVTIDVQIDRSTICRMVTPARAAVYECPDSLLEEAAEYKSEAE